MVLSGCYAGWRLVDESEGRFRNDIEKLSYLKLPAEVKNGFSGMEFNDVPYYVCDSVNDKVSRYFILSDDQKGVFKGKPGYYLRINGKKYFLDGVIASPIVVCDNSIFYTRDAGVKNQPDSIRNKVTFYRADLK